MLKDYVCDKKEEKQERQAKEGSGKSSLTVPQSNVREWWQNTGDGF